MGDPVGAASYAGASDQQGDADGRVVVHEFAPEPVEAGHFAVIARVDDDRVVEQAGVFQDVHEVADAVVHEVDAGVVPFAAPLGLFRGQIVEATSGKRFQTVGEIRRRTDRGEFVPVGAYVPTGTV